MKEIEAKLKQEQLEAAKLLAVNNFLPHGRKLTPEERQRKRENGEVRLTYEEIAEKVGASTKQLFNWRYENPDFITYVNGLVSHAFMAKLPEVVEKHLDMTLKGNGSMKGIELFYKFGGLLVDKAEVKQTEEGGQGVEELEERLQKLKERREGKKEDEV